MHRHLLRLIAVVVAVHGFLALNSLSKSAMTAGMMREISIVRLVRDDPSILLISIPALLLFAAAIWLWSAPSYLSEDIGIDLNRPDAFYVAIKLLGIYFLVPAVCEIAGGMFMFLLLDTFKESGRDQIALAYVANAMLSDILLALIGGAMVFSTDRVFKLVSRN